METTGRSLLYRRNRNISARIPHQSPPCGGDSFLPGEAIAPVALEHACNILYFSDTDNVQRKKVPLWNPFRCACWENFL